MMAWMLAALILFGLMGGTYVLSRIIRNSGIVDVIWGLGIALVGIYFLMTVSQSSLQILVVTLVTIWAVRLGGFIYWTRIRRAHVDHRYETLSFSMLANYGLQVTLQLVICTVYYPVFFGANSSISWLAVGLFVLALAGETLADWQLARFKATQSGICNVGLWAISRHPNYFFEVLVWVALAWLSKGWIGWIAPATVWVIVRYITGPYTERLSISRRGGAYQAYQSEVPMIIPSLPMLLFNYIQLPDWLYRIGILRLLKKRLANEAAHGQSVDMYVESLRSQPITIETAAANSQHYEVPTAFYDVVLGKQKKYSSCWFDETTSTLDAAEEAMLKLTCERAEIRDGDTVLDLGCGWGSVSLYIARHYPNCQITSVSNSRTQRAYIEQFAKDEELSINVITQDVRVLKLEKTFDRIVSVEMLEHVRNYEALFAKIATWLKPDGRFFVHIFGHKLLAYTFDNDTSWMAKHFFSGGQMPSRDLFTHFQKDLSLIKTWAVSGTHYQKTCRFWLDNMDANRKIIRKLFTQTQWIYWRLFFMACEELFGYNQGDEWQVYHYAFKRKMLDS